jgi:hypothetical protein
MTNSILPSWPNTNDHRAAWEQAKRELGQDAGVSAIARKAQDILIRSRMPEEDEMERARR